MITLITDRSLCETSIVGKIKTLVEEKKIDQVILREKDLNEKELYYLYRIIDEVLKNTNINLIVNTNLKFAQKYKINQIHLSQENFKKVKKKEAIDHLDFGISVHSMDEVQSALTLEPNYLLLSPIFKTNCKKEKKPLGIEFLKRIREITDIPIIALGGINDRNIIMLNELNFNNVAMRSNLLL